MKTFRYTLATLLLALIVISCKNETSPETKIVEVTKEEVKEKVLNPDANYVAAKFEIDGMTCAMGCAKVIEKNLAQMDGVKTVKVDFESKTADVEFDEEMVNKDLVIANVKNTGEAYQVISWNGEQINKAEEQKQ